MQQRNQASSNDPYHGQKLGRPDEQIRLLELFPGAGEEVVRCKTSVVALRDSPAYTALSYVWGVSSEWISIIVNGKDGHLVSPNLYEALQHFRDSEQTLTFWIDALCINQSDDEEKSHQVRIMGDIYKNAAHTWIWLGKESEDSDRAMDLISQLDGEDLTSPRNTIDVEGLEAIAGLLRRPWWSRVWIIQEALLSPNPMVKCGGKTLSLDAFVRIDDIRRGWHRTSKKYRHGDKNSIVSFTTAFKNPFSAILTYWDETREQIRRGESSLSTWAGYLDNFESTNPRDKIYGLLGLGTDVDRKIVKVSYGSDITTGMVYNIASIWFLKCTRSLILFQFDIDNKASAPRGDEETTLLSWVPDYSRRPPTDDPDWVRPGYVPFVSQSGCEYTAHGDETLIQKRIPDAAFRLNISIALYLRCIVVDTVSFVSGNPHAAPYARTNKDARIRFSMERVRTTAARLATWEQEALKDQPDEPYGRGLAKQKAFRRTLVANRDADWFRIQDQSLLGENYEVFMARADVPKEYAEANQELSVEEIFLQYLFSLRLACVPRVAGRNFIVTSKGYFGLAPLKTRIGDQVCILEGGMIPLVLRAVDDSELPGIQLKLEGKQRCFRVVGESYVHGVSDGDWIKTRNEEDVIEAVLV